MTSRKSARGRHQAVLLAVLVVPGLALAPTAHAATAPARPAYCGAYVIGTVDWLLVHTARSLSSPARGQIPGRSCWYDTGDGTENWRQGFGYNGSTKVPGYVDAHYIVDD